MILKRVRIGKTTSILKKLTAILTSFVLLFSMANFTAYAQATCTVTLDKNYGEPDKIPVTVTVNYDQSISPQAYYNTINRFRTGYSFAGWNTEKDGTGTKVSIETKITSDITLYAQWAQYIVTFDKNGGDTDISPKTATATYNAITWPANPKKTGFSFVGWNTKSDGTGDMYPPFDYIDETMTLYAIWGAPNWQNHVASGYAGGSGTEKDPYQIATPEQLAYLAYQVNNTHPVNSEAENSNNKKHYILTNNIDLSAYEWIPIGNYHYDFQGVFNGGGHTITGLRIGTASSPNPTIHEVGLFGHIQSATIKNIAVDASIFSNPTLQYKDYCIGTITGSANYSTIENCSVTGNLQSFLDNSSIGGVAGDSSETNISNCFASVDVLGGDASISGGLVGNCAMDHIINCGATGNVTAGKSLEHSLSSAGGLLGDIEGETTVKNSYATGNVQTGDAVGSNTEGGFTTAGGFIGDILFSGSCENCYATGSVIAGKSDANKAIAGGFIGFNEPEDSITLSNCYWNTDAQQKVNETVRDKSSKLGIGSGIGTATGKSSSEMQSNTFAQLLTNNRTQTSEQKAWSYVSSKNNGYPLMDGVGYDLASNANLSALTVSSGTLSPSFHAGTQMYLVSVDNTVSTITVTPTVEYKDATVTVNGAAVASGHASQPISLTKGAKTNILVEVTSKNGSVSKAYTISVSTATSNIITDSKTSVTFDMSNATLPPYVTSVSVGNSTLPQDSSICESVRNLFAGDTSFGKDPKFVIYNLKLLDQKGNPISDFKGTIKVKIPIPDGFNGNLHILWYDDKTGKLTDMNAVVEGNYLVFETNHFSYYTIAQLSGTSNTNHTASNPDTGCGNSPVIPLSLLLCVSSSAGLVIVKERKNWKIKNCTVNQ